MTGPQVTRRGLLAAGAAALVLPRAVQAAPAELRAGVAMAQIAPAGYPATEVWAYDGQLPGPTLRAPQGSRFARRFVNGLEVPSSVHWHGIRIDNAMDGVAGLTQDPVPPGGHFDYDFDLPDAGTYWYHAHTNSMEQVARGLAGALIVNEAVAPDVDRDEVWVLDDWLVDPDTLQIDPGFGRMMDLSHSGRTGNLVGTNGQFGYGIEAMRNERLRLRLINAANARIFVLSLDGLDGWVVALDGMPLAAPERVGAEVIIAPAQRIDLIVDVTAAPGSDAALLRLDQDGTWQPQVRVSVTGEAARTPRPAPAALPPNSRMAVPGLADARRFEMRMEGGMMGGMRAARYEGQERDARTLAQRGQFWALNGTVGRTETPFADLARGETVRVALINDTAFPHAMHLHGMHFREVAGDGTLGPLRDTVLSLPGEPTEIAFVADNPGDWLFHCHMLGHAASGMTTWVRVS
ncbi:MAG: multicopper oxidase family protein [Maritimibacter sp.]|nr:multicopper oxidase family protein [Maritimibacter sp.]